MQPPPPFRVAQSNRRSHTTGPFSPHLPPVHATQFAGGCHGSAGVVSAARPMVESRSCMHLDKGTTDGASSMAATTARMRDSPTCNDANGPLSLPRVASAPTVMSLGETLGCGRQAVAQRAVLTSAKYPVALIRGRDALSDDVKALLGDMVRSVRCSNLVDVYHIVYLPPTLGGLPPAARALSPHSPTDPTMVGHDAVVMQLCECTLQDLFHNEATRRCMTRRGFGDAIQSLVGISLDRPLPCDAPQLGDNNDATTQADDKRPTSTSQQGGPSHDEAAAISLDHEGPVPADDAADVVVSEVFLSFLALDVLNGLSALHARHIAHGDLKASNVFLTSDGTFAVGDFLMAQRFEAPPPGGRSTGAATHGSEHGIREHECVHCGRKAGPPVVGADAAVGRQAMEHPHEHGAVAAAPQSPSWLPPPSKTSQRRCMWCAGPMPLAQRSDVRAFALLMAQAALLGRLPAANVAFDDEDRGISGSSCWISWECLSSHFSRNHYSLDFRGFLEAAFCGTCTTTAALLQQPFLSSARHRQKAQRVQLIRAAFLTGGRHGRHGQEDRYGVEHHYHCSHASSPQTSGSACGTPVSSPTSRERAPHAVGTPTSAYHTGGTPTSTESWAAASLNGFHQALQRHTPRAQQTARHPHATEKSRAIIHQPSGRK